MKKIFTHEVLGLTVFVYFDMLVKEHGVYNFYLNDVLVCRTMSIFKFSFYSREDDLIYFKFDCED